jgi:hypothetical protein
LATPRADSAGSSLNGALTATSPQRLITVYATGSMRRCCPAGNQICGTTNIRYQSLQFNR